MPDYVHDIPAEDWSAGTWNTQLTGGLFSYDSPAKNAYEISSMIGAIKMRREVVFYADILLTPHLDSISPDEALVGDGPLTVTLVGEFSSTDLAYWNGVTIPTTFIDSSTLEVTVSALLLSVEGCGAIAVANQAGSWSNALPFHVNAPAGAPIY